MPSRREFLEGSVLVAGSLLASRLFAAEQPPSKPFDLPPLPYPYEALEPHIDAETMRLHHDKHHATYVTKLNEAVAAAPALAGRTLEALLRDLAGLPDNVRTAVRNHGGGHSNHTLFWTSLKAAQPPRNNAPELVPGAFATAVASEFGSLTVLKETLAKSATGVFGSGWAWLTYGPDRKLQVEATANQDSPLSAGRTPLLGLDVWEHAYYLRYQNRRPDYLAALWNVVDWGSVAGRFDAVRAAA